MFVKLSLRPNVKSLRLTAVKVRWGACHRYILTGRPGLCVRQKFRAALSDKDALYANVPLFRGNGAL